MRLTVTIGERRVDVRTGPGDKVTLRAVEAAAVRLLHALPAPSEPAPVPFGFSLSSDTERAPELLELEDDDE
jgi:hypothetical protein